MTAAPDGSPSDEELVRRARNGDEAARSALVGRHARQLRARAQRLLPRVLRRKVAESDIVQEAWIAAFLRLGEFEERGEGSFARWMATVLDRKVLDEVRRFAGTGKRDVRREVAAGSSVERHAGAASDPSPSTEAVRGEERTRIDAAMATLPEPQRAVISLVQEERLTFEQAGARIGRSADAARKLYGRAVLAFAAALEPTPPAGG